MKHAPETATICLGRASRKDKNRLVTTVGEAAVVSQTRRRKDPCLA